MYNNYFILIVQIWFEYVRYGIKRFYQICSKYYFAFIGNENTQRVFRFVKRVVQPCLNYFLEFVRNEKTKRFARIWSKYFTIIFFVIFASVIVGGFIGYFVVEMIHIFGLKTVALAVFGIWLLLLVGCAAAALSEAELNKMLHKEDEVMRKMRDDYEKL